MNAIDFLLKEHDKVRRTLADISIDSHTIETKKKLFSQLCKDLIRHETMEHDIWYPHFKGDKQLDSTVKHLISEEKHAEKAIASFDNLKTDKEWETKFSKFKSEVEHHAREEETKLFPKIKSMFSDAELEDIGHQMYEFKQKYVKENA